MGQVQNDYLYIRYRSSSIKNKANECKAYKLHPFATLLLNLVLLAFIKVKKTKPQISILFSFFFSFSDQHVLKTIWCIWILYVPNDCSMTRHLPFLVWGGVWATTGELQPQNCFQKCLMCLIVDFWGLCSIIPGLACIVRPHPDYWMCATPSKQKFG